MSSSLHLIALSNIPGIGDAIGKQLISYLGSAEAIFNTRKGKLLKIPGIGPKLANQIMSSETLKDAEKELELAEKNNTQILSYFDKRYPQKLKHILDAPLYIYYKGNSDLNSSKIISIVGTRQATEYGKSTVEEFVKTLKKYDDLLVVSGLAYGIDIFAHKACLKNNIPTIGVMANGMDMVYPALHKNIANDMIKNGGLITENSFGSLPDAPKFPERNRIIAGMSDAVIVVEATEKGGALITADIANSYDREVFAVPGNLNKKTSIGCNKLIRDHKANIITRISDLDYHLNWDISDTNLSTPIVEPKNLNPFEKTIFNLLLKSDLHIDELSFRSQIPINNLSSILLHLEMENIIKSLPGKRFSLKA